MRRTPSSDRGVERPVTTHEHTGARRRRKDGERGQAMVEFALILFPLLILVAGIIQFGIGLNYWLDANRIANQGARFAVVCSVERHLDVLTGAHVAYAGEAQRLQPGSDGQALRVVDRGLERHVDLRKKSCH